MHGRNSHKHNYARIPWKKPADQTRYKKKNQTTQRRKGFRREQSSIQQMLYVKTEYMQLMFTHVKHCP